ncbi:SCO family protein [Leptospira haakeii]|uniref:Electron transporter SenC n=1 Tax=Leptospira haakeii TaxID=2023198 RepID=A0ABX4PK41_9LEPT|nr:SCO family protein [Leptospira haakeii]PKA15413.1 electron transporter SenC [Leptospira haakeii]PKA18756.1 electron transporter SenC [Leptospira haakeii]
MQTEIWKLALGGLTVIFPLFYFLPSSSSGMMEADRSLPEFLISEEGNKKEDIRNTLSGKENLVYFGYLNCKTVCHGSLKKLKNLISKQKDLRLVFVSLDPEKDTEESFEKYFSDLKIETKFIRLESRGRAFELARLFGIMAFSSDKSGDIDHPDSVLWVNSEGRIKGLIFEFDKHWDQNPKELIKFISDKKERKPLNI